MRSGALTQSLHQLVSSATSNSQTDAFKWLSNGAGKDIFEVFLKVNSATSLFSSCRSDVKLALHCSSIRHYGMFARKSASGFKMDLRHLHDSLWTVQCHHSMVCRLYCVYGCPAYCCRLEEYWKVSTGSNLSWIGASLNYVS